MTACRVVVLAARGKTFCAGGDLGWMRAQFEAAPAQRAAEAAKLAHMLQALNTLPKPLIGCVHGHAFGGGVGLMSVCDVAIGADQVQMALTETRLGLIPATIGPYVAARMGEARARRVFMSGRRFDACRGGGSGACWPARCLRRISTPRSRPRSRPISTARPVRWRAPRRCCAAWPADRRCGDRHSIDALAECWAGEEAAEGIAAFFDRRTPRWRS